MIMKIKWHEDNEAFLLFGAELNKIIAGDWVHIALVRTGAETFKLYLNGVLCDPNDNSGVKTISGLTADTEIDIIGTGWGSGVAYSPWEGYIDDVTLFNDVKTTADIVAIYNTGEAVDLMQRAIYKPDVAGSPYSLGFNGTSTKVTIPAASTDIETLFNGVEKLTIAFWVNTKGNTRSPIFSIRKPTNNYPGSPGTLTVIFDFSINSD